MDKTNDLSIRLAHLSDKELLQVLSDNSKIYSDEAIQTVQQIAHSRGLLSNFANNEFKVITTGGRENGPFDVITIKDLFLKKLINEESLLYVDSQGQWLSLQEVFNTTLWTTKDEEVKEIVDLTNESYVNSAKITARPDKLKTGNPKTAKPEKKQSANIVDANTVSEIPSQYSGVGGWLKVFVYFLLLVRLFGLIVLNNQLDRSPPTIRNFALTIGIIDYAIGVIIALLLVFKAKKVVFVVKIYLICLPIINLIFLFSAIFGGKDIKFLMADKVFLLSYQAIGVILIQITTMGRFIVIQPNIAQTLFLICLATIWYLYFTFSKRVKATYEE